MSARALLAVGLGLSACAHAPPAARPATVAERPLVTSPATVAPHTATVAATPETRAGSAPPVVTVRLPIARAETLGDGQVACQRALPACAHVFVAIDAPPHPCENRGAACLETPRRPTGWICTCEACSGDGDCAPDQRCEHVPPTCPPRRHPGQCVTGARVVESQTLCPAPP